VADLTGFDAVRVDPFEGMAAARAAGELLARESSACLVACGLAMRGDST
jgi:Tfp pilus assembly PilM family ATPase